MFDLSGRTLGNQFRLERLLGRGGMDDVYLAEQLEVGRRVVVKVLRAPLLAAPQSEERFRREARALAQLNHPNIVHLYTAGRTEDELAYLAMEYVAGETLGSLVAARGALPEREVLAILDQLCSALAEAHGRGVIHRDLKPDNVMVLERPEQPPLVKVLDFGIAKLAHMPDAHITRDGEVMGTPLYMAPEQLRNKQVDERADIYALGAIGYELLTGHVPFEGDTTLAVIARVLSEPVVPPRERIPGLPLSAAMDALIARCLAKEPEARFASARVLREALREIARSAGDTPSRAEPPPEALWRHAREVADELRRKPSPTPMAVEERDFPLQLRAADGLSLAVDDEPEDGPVAPRRSRRPVQGYIGLLAGLIGMSIGGYQFYTHILQPKLDDAPPPSTQWPAGAPLPLREWVQGIPFPQGTQYAQFEATVIDATIPAAAADVHAFYAGHLAASWGGLQPGADGSLTFADPHSPVARITFHSAAQGTRIVITRRPSAKKPP